MSTTTSSSSPPLHEMPASAAAGSSGPNPQSSQQQQQHARPVSIPQTRRAEEKDKSRNKRMNQYSFEAQIGKGQHGTVKRAVNNDDGVKYAIKIVSRKPKQKHLPRADTAGSVRPLGNSPLANKISSTENKIRKEIAIMKKCRHHHVVQLFDVIDDPSLKRVFLVMEYMGGGELKWRNKHHEPILSLEQVRRIARDVVLGVEYLHYQGIIHRDIKPANILYSADRSYVKLADFGSAHFSYAQRLASAGRSAAGLEEPIEEVLLNEADLAKTAGSPAFFAPELCFQGDDNDGSVPNHQLPSRYQITKALDVWALGITLYTLLYGNIPYDVRTEFELYDTIPNHQFIFPDEMTADRIAFALQPRDSFASHAINLLESTLQKDPSKRITIEGVKRHPFIIGDIPVDQREQWLRDTSPARNALVEVSIEDAQGAIAKVWTAERFRAYWRKVTTVRPKTSGNTVGSPPSRQTSVQMMDALIGSSHGSGTVGRSRSEKSPKRRKRDVAKDIFHGPHGPSGSGTKSAVDLPTNGASRASRPARPQIITNNTGGSSSSQPPLSSSPPSRASSPARITAPATRANGFFSLNLFNRFRRPKSETTMVTAYTPRLQSVPVNRSNSATDATHSEKSYSHSDYHQDDHDDHEQPFSPVSQESSTDDDEDFGTIADAHHAAYMHRDSAGSSLTVSTHSDMADPSARVIGAGGYGIEPQHASPDGVESSSLPSGPSSLRTPPLLQPSPRVAGTALQIVPPKMDSWDPDSTIPTKSRTNAQNQVPPRSGVSSPLGRVAYQSSPSNSTQTQHLDDVFVDDEDNRPVSRTMQRPRVNSVPIPSGTPSGRRHYNEDDDSDGSSASCHSDGNGDDDTDGHGYVQMAPRRPSTSAQNSPSGPSSGAQSPAMSPPRRTIGLGVSVGASQP